MATDNLGGETLSKPVKLRVDGQPPVAHVTLNRHNKSITAKIMDANSGLRTGSTRINYGDGSHQRGRSKFHHQYANKGTFMVSVRARDRVGNQLVENLKVTVR